MPTHDQRTSVLLIDRIGYRAYHRADGSSFFPPDRYRVSVITDRAKAGEVIGPEIAAVVGIDIDDLDLLYGAARLLDRTVGVDSVVAISERLLLPAARLRDELGVPGLDEEHTLLVRNKLRMKEHLAANGIRVPDFAPYTPEAAATLLNRYGRVVLKPTEGMGSVGIFIAADQAELDRFAAGNPALTAENYEVEQFVDGTLYHVDSVVQAGEPVVATAARYIDPTLNYLDVLPCRDVGLGPGQVRDALLAFNESVVKCYPWFTGAMHHEMFLDADGVPWFVEIAGRPGGGGIIPGFRRGTGIDLNEAAVLAQLTGESPAPAVDEGLLTGYVMLYHAAGTLADTPAPPAEPWLIDLEWWRHAGQSLSAPARWSDAVAVASVTGTTEAEVAERLDQLTRHVQSRLG